jgi:hypothetical protein
MYVLPKGTRDFEPISYREAPLSTLLHATVYVYTQFAECTGTDGSQMEVRLSSLRTGHALVARNIIFLLLVLISVTGWVNRMA